MSDSAAQLASATSHHARDLAYHYALETLSASGLFLDVDEILDMASAYAQAHWNDWLSQAQTLAALPRIH